MGVSICEHTTCTRTHVSSKMINPFIQKKINASYYYRDFVIIMITPYLITYIQIVKIRCFLRSIHRNNHFIKFHIIFIRRDTNLFIIFTSLAYLTLIFCQAKKLERTEIFGSFLTRKDDTYFFVLRHLFLFFSKTWMLLVCCTSTQS